MFFYIFYVEKVLWVQKKNLKFLTFLAKCDNLHSNAFNWLADLWRSRSCRYCVYIWGKYCCCWDKHYNTMHANRWSPIFSLVIFLFSFYFLYQVSLVCVRSLHNSHIFCASDANLLELKQSKGKYAKFICDMTKFYRDFHVKSDGVYGMPWFRSLIALNIDFLISTSIVFPSHGFVLSANV